MIRLLMVLILTALPESPAGAKDVAFERDRLTIEKAGGGQEAFDVEMALTPAQQQQGLMYRTELTENAGMLFVFKRTQRLSFWMKNTLIPLDMLFIGADGTIRHIHRRAMPLDEKGISSGGPVRAVLELRGGECDRSGIRKGDRVIHRAFGNTLAD